MLNFPSINLLSVETWVVMGTIVQANPPTACVFKLASLYLSLLDMGLGVQQGQHVLYINISRSTLLPDRQYSFLCLSCLASFMF